MNEIKCLFCSGSGEYNYRSNQLPCPVCDATGHLPNPVAIMPEDNKIEIEIEPIKDPSIRALIEQPASW